MEGTGEVTDKQPKRLSGNVQRLRFMRTAATAQARRDEMSAAARIEPAWTIDEVAFSTLRAVDIPKPFLETEVTERIPLRQMHRRPFQGFNGAAERMNKTILAKIKRQRTETEDEAMLQALTRRQ